MSMIAVSASEIEITSPVAGKEYYVWDEVPITWTSTLGEECNCSSFVNDEPTNVFSPEIGGKYVIKVICENCSNYAQQIFNIGFFPRAEKTRIKITSPVPGTEYYVGDIVPIEFESPLTDRDDFIFNTYVIGPDRVKRMVETWNPTEPGRYSIKVEAVGENTPSFASTLGCKALANE
jgi:hypothetical protein